MKNNKIRFLLCVLFFAVLAAITFRCVWPADHVFAASDLNIGRLAFKKHHLPELLTGFFSANQVMGGSSYGFTLFHVLMTILPLELFANTFYGMVLVFGASALVWFLRLWERSWLASITGAVIAFWFNSIMLAAGGHAYKMEVLAFSVLCLCFIEKSVRGKSVRQTLGYALFAGICVGIMMIEQQDVALLAGLFIGSYALFRLVQVHLKSIERWVALLLPIAVVALLISGSTVMKSYKANIKGAAAVQGDGTEKWNYITQWSMVPSEWPDLIAFGWSGWSSNNPEGPYWGKIGQSAEWESTKKGFRNFKLTSVYFGIIPFLLGTYGMFCAVRSRKEEHAGVMVFWSIAGLLGLWLAFGKYSLLYKLFYHLPMVGNIRAPMKFLDNFQICLGIVAAYGLDRLVEEGKGAKIAKVFWIVAGACFVLMLSAGLKVLLFPMDWKIRFAEMGFGTYADVMLSNMSTAWFHASVLCFIFAACVFAAWKGLKRARWIALVFVVVLGCDSVWQTSRYFTANNIATLEKGNVLTNYLKANQGNERTYFVDQGGIYNQWLASDGPFHGLNLFNIWQMPRMPVEYKEYLGKVGRNQIRLWQLSAIKYVAMPQQVLKQNPGLEKMFKPALNYQVPTAQGMRPDVLLEFKAAVPRFALFQSWKTAPRDQHCDILVSPQHNPQAMVLVDSVHDLDAGSGNDAYLPVVAKTTKRKAVIEVQVEQPAILRFSQRSQPGWKVYVDGKPSELLRVDYLSMGVLIPPGKHVVEFRCVTGAAKVFFTMAVFMLAVVGGVVLVRKRKTSE